MDDRLEDSGAMVGRLREAVTDWDGTQMDDGEPPRDILQCRDLRETAATIERLRGENADLSQTFQMMWDADMRGIKQWQEATGREFTWPSREQLILFLLERAEKAEAALLYLMERFDSEVWNCPRCGHSEDTSTTDSADYLREWLKVNAIEASS